MGAGTVICVGETLEGRPKVLMVTGVVDVGGQHNMRRWTSADPEFQNFNFIRYNCLRCTRNPSLVNGTLERNDNTLFSSCWRMRIGIKENRLTKLNNDNMKEFTIAIRIA